MTQNVSHGNKRREKQNKPLNVITCTCTCYFLKLMTTFLTLYYAYLTLLLTIFHDTPYDVMRWC